MIEESMILSILKQFIDISEDENGEIQINVVNGISSDTLKNSNLLTRQMDENEYFETLNYIKRIHYLKYEFDPYYEEKGIRMAAIHITSKGIAYYRSSIH
jgi:hypothetical protein